MGDWGFVEIRRQGNIDVLEVKLARPIRADEIDQIVKAAEDAYWSLGEHGDILVISGRMPLWLAAALVHEFSHLYKAVATFDPKLGGAVIICSHDPRYKVGEVVPL